MKRNDCDTDPEANAGEPVDDGWPDPVVAAEHGLASDVLANLSHTYVEQPCGKAAKHLGHHRRTAGVLYVCDGAAEVNDGVDSGAVPGQPAG